MTSITWRTKDSGREGDLATLNRDRNNLLLPRLTRQQADKAHAEVVRQLKDTKLMAMRERLIKAAKAHDLVAQDKIGRQMKAYQKQDQETGL